MNRGFLVLFERWREQAHYQAAGDGCLLEQYLSARDEGALRALVARHAGHLFALCYAELGSQPQAEDAFQETMLALLRWSRFLRRKQAVCAWLRRTARRICRRMKQRGLGQRRVESAWAARQPNEREADAIDAAEREELRLLVASSVAGLPERYRVPMSMRYLQHQSPDEIAGILGLPVKTVKTRITRGRRALRRKLLARSLTTVAASACWTSQAQATPPGLVEATVQTLLQTPLPARGMSALAASVLGHWTRWRWPALCVLLAGVGFGGAAWAFRDKGEPPPAPPVQVVQETTEQRNLRVLREDIVPKLLEALQPLLFGGGELNVLETSAEGTYVRCLIEGKHKIGFTSRLRLRYQTLNGGLAIELDEFNTGKWKLITPHAPIQLFMGELSPAMININLIPSQKVVAAFHTLTPTPPREIRTSALTDGRVSRRFLEAVQDYLGAWLFSGETAWAPTYIYISAEGRLLIVDQYGTLCECEVILSDNGPAEIRNWGRRLLLHDQGRRLDLDPSGWWWTRAP
jgi:RNA polymerase sigma-70 factor (ECF subfamily)